MFNQCSTYDTTPLSYNSTCLCPTLKHLLLSSSNPGQGANRLVVSVHGILSVSGILENALILWVVGFQVRRTVAAVWVLNLALSDFLATLTLPFFTYYLYSSHSWELGEQLCVAQATMFFVNMFASAFLLAVISLDRCLLVMLPIWTKRKRSLRTAWRICGLGWTWAFLNSLPYATFRAIARSKDGRNLCYNHFARFSTPASLEHDCQLRLEATIYSKFLLAFLVPLSIIAGSYACLGWRLKQRERHRVGDGAMRVQSNPLSPRFSRMVVAAVAIFILCWLPYHIFCLMEAAAVHQPRLHRLVEVGQPIAATISFLNAILNPFIYASSCPQFCLRIRQSLGILLDGLLAEEEMHCVNLRYISSNTQSNTQSNAPRTPFLMEGIVKINKQNSMEQKFSEIEAAEEVGDRMKDKDCFSVNQSAKNGQHFS